MAQSKYGLRAAYFSTALAVVLLLWSGASAAKPRRSAVVYVSDGMRQDLLQEFALQGRMPVFRLSMLLGTTAPHGMIPAVPSNSAVGWSTILTGASPASSGITNNLFHVNTEDFDGWEPHGDGFDPANRLSAGLAETAEAAGLTTAVLNWVGFAPYDGAPSIRGPVLDYYPDWLTGRGVVANYEIPGMNASAISRPAQSEGRALPVLR